jgi:hypothetical protein
LKRAVSKKKMTEKELITACEHNEISRVLSLLEEHYVWTAIVRIFFYLREKKKPLGKFLLYLYDRAWIVMKEHFFILLVFTGD